MHLKLDKVFFLLFTTTNIVPRVNVDAHSYGVCSVNPKYRHSSPGRWVLFEQCIWVIIKIKKVSDTQKFDLDLFLWKEKYSDFKSMLINPKIYSAIAANAAGINLSSVFELALFFKGQWHTEIWYWPIFIKDKKVFKFQVFFKQTINIWHGRIDELYFQFESYTNIIK